MLIEDFIIHAFCLIHDLSKETQNSLNIKNLRSSGAPPLLDDSEVITMEVVGEFLSIDTDKGIWSYFLNNWKSMFPMLSSRSSFVRQAANTWALKQSIHKRLVDKLSATSDYLHIVDGFPMPVCKFSRANKLKIFRGNASFGYCASKNEKYYGFHGHIAISGAGVVTSFDLTPANGSERECVYCLTKGLKGLLLGDKGYISKDLKADLKTKDIDLETPLRDNMEDTRPSWIQKLLLKTRRLVETVIGQLCERFNIEKVRARDPWHLTSRISRKVLSHTVGIFINRAQGNPSLQFDLLGFT